MTPRAGRSHAPGGRSQHDRGVQAWKAAFLAAYTEPLTVGAACRAAGISRQTFRTACATDPDFAREVAHVHATARAHLEMHLTHLALRGSDTALLNRLRDFDPSWRRPTRRRAPPRDGGPMLVTVADLAELAEQDDDRGG